MFDKTFPSLGRKPASPRNKPPKSTATPPSPPPQASTAIPSSLLIPEALKQQIKPAFDLVPCKAVVAAEQAHGYGSPQHLAALDIANQALSAYIAGEAWPDPDYWPSPQQRVPARTEKEIAMGGARGGTKTFTGIMFNVRGNYYEPLFLHDSNGNVIENNPVHRSYIYHPHYFAVCIRKNREDLKQWIDEARSVYEKMGGKWMPGDHCFRWYTPLGTAGAHIYTGHLADPDSYRHYIGLNIHTLAIEELIQLPEEGPYEELRASVRSKYPEISPKIFVSFNPEGGPGVQWVYDRFIEPKQKLDDGRKIPICFPGTSTPIHVYNHDWTPVYPEPTIREEVDVEVYKRIGIPVPPQADRYEDRVFIPARLVDNPYLMQNYSYVNALARLPKAKRDAYLYGIWSFAGAFFSEFRPKGPLPGEPPTANHVIPTYPAPSFIIPRPSPDPSLTIPSREIQYWWPRVIGGDWGYEHEAAFYWCATDPSTKQRLFYREFVTAKSTPETVGADLARHTISDLNRLPSHAITLWVGFDPSAANRIGQDRTLFELLARGIQRILGPNSCHLPDYLINKLREEAYTNNAEVDEKLIEAIRTQRRAGITIRLSRYSRIMGWQLMQEFIRWEPIFEDNTGLRGFDPKLASRLLFDEGQEAYRNYLASCQREGIEVLPKWLICDCCPRLIEALPKLQRESRDGKSPEDADPRHFTGMDSVDAARYTILASRDEEGFEPEEAFVERRMSDILSSPEAASLSVNDRIRIRNSLEREHQQKSAPMMFQVRHQASRMRQAARRELTRWINPGSPGGGGITGGGGGSGNTNRRR